MPYPDKNDPFELTTMKEKLENIGFIVLLNQKNKINPAVLNRYQNIPEDYLNFISGIEICVTKDNKAWFNTMNSFNSAIGNEFQWNKFELMSLESYADETDEDKKKIIEFWDRHIPILLSCRNFYCCFAISLLSASYGQIVYGSEPEFEETEWVADDFSSFMTQLTGKTLNKKYVDQII